MKELHDWKINDRWNRIDYGLMINVILRLEYIRYRWQEDGLRLNR